MSYKITKKLGNFVKNTSKKAKVKIYGGWHTESKEKVEVITRHTQFWIEQLSCFQKQWRYGKILLSFKYNKITFLRQEL